MLIKTGKHLEEPCSSSIFVVVGPNHGSV